ncbi:VOC family protein [Pseudaestuariivita sp.]|uniref:VOC family protein n=1 Tax=Pseudaestuariivita sp. TaxID=2211669 RepID=UPI004059866B
MPAQFEHVNVTVSDLDRSVAMVTDLFGWHVRWRGKTMTGSETAHVGTNAAYVALYQHHAQTEETPSTYTTPGSLNHIGVVVDDLPALEAKVKAMGFETHGHADYEPGQRFYFFDADKVEYEVVSYARTA